jgi:hypothetical protein
VSLSKLVFFLSLADDIESLPKVAEDDVGREEAEALPCIVLDPGDVSPK